MAAAGLQYPPASVTAESRAAEALIQAGNSHEFVLLPEQTHDYDRVRDGYFWRTVGDFFHRALHVDPAVRSAERVRRK